MAEKPKILALQPFYSGSHRAVMQGWVRHSQLDWTVISLPGELWKWRMRYAAIHFAREANRLVESGSAFDAVFCTDMMNLAEFKGLVDQRIAGLPAIVYFHENQLAYPVKNPQRHDLHFSFTNLVSALAADEIWFNSNFNRDSMHELLCQHSQSWPDKVLQDEINQIQQRGVAHYPGIEIPVLSTRNRSVESDQPLHIVWAARWEYDKGPDKLLEAIRFLVRQKADFQLSIIGESFQQIPDEFDAIKKLCPQKIINWGYQESRDDYWQVLMSADVFISTAKHEFFGLSAAEAIIANCYPLLPKRLAYPELLDVNHCPENEVFLYDEKQICLGQRLLELINDKSKLTHATRLKLSERFEERFCWKVRARAQDEAIKKLTR